MLPDTVPTRKQRFDAALKLAGLTLNGFCDINHVSRGHLRAVFAGERDASARVNDAIDTLIEHYFPALDGAA